MKRTLLLGTAWTASAAAAVGLGFLATSLVDASSSPDTSLVAATGTSAGTTTATATRTPARTSPAASGEHATEAGTVYASCAGRVPTLAGAPAAGWWIDDSAKPGEIEFENGAAKLEVQVSCVDGSPRFSVEGPRPERGERDDDSSASPTRTSAPRPTSVPSSTYSYTEGRPGGGHGADDPPGDDSAGRTGGGHGSDDGPDDSRVDNSGSDDDGSDGRGRGRGRGSDD